MWILGEPMWIPQPEPMWIPQPVSPACPGPGAPTLASWSAAAGSGDSVALTDWVGAASRRPPLVPVPATSQALAPAVRDPRDILVLVALNFVTVWRDA